MKTTRVIATTFALLWFGIAAKAEATINSVSNMVCTPYTLSHAENQASLIACTGDSTLTSLCGNLLYVLPEDKEIFATVLTAQAQLEHVAIMYDSSASSVTLGSYSITSSCKLLMVHPMNASY